MARLPIRVRPFVGESQAGYILRLAMRNGFMKPEDIVNKKVFNLAIRNNLKKADINNISSLIQSSISFSETEGSPFPKVCSSARILHARACLKCLNENPFHRDNWQDPRYTHCAKHQVMLIDVCPHCEHELEFNASLLQGYCSNEYCGRKLIQLSVDEKIKRLTTGNIEDCIIAGLYVLEISELKRKAYFNYKDIPTILTAGIDLLTNNEALGHWLAKISSKGLPAGYPKNLAYPELYSLSCHIHRDWNLIKRAQIDSRKPSLQLTSTSKPLEIRILASCLGLNAADLKPLWYKNILRFSNTNRYQVDGLLDAKQLIEELVTKSTSEVINEVDFMEATKFVEQYLMEKSDLLLAIFLKDLPFYYQGNSSLLDSIYFNRDELIKVGERHLESSKARTVSIDTCAKIAKISPKTIKNAISSGLIKSSDWKADNSTLKVIELKKLQELHNNRQLNLPL